MESLSILNKRLADSYGKELDGRSRYKIVFSDTEYEKRFGTFEEHYGHIFIREVTGMKECPKYSYLKSKWVLEKLLFGHNPEKPGVMSHYEPIWSFDRMPIWRAIQFVMHAHLFGVKKTMSDYRNEEEAAKEEDIKEFEEILGTGGVHEMRNQKVNFVKPVFVGGKVYAK